MNRAKKSFSEFVSAVVGAEPNTQALARRWLGFHAARESADKACKETAADLLPLIGDDPIEVDGMGSVYRVKASSCTAYDSEEMRAKIERLAVACAGLAAKLGVPVPEGCDAVLPLKTVTKAAHLRAGR